LLGRGAFGEVKLSHSKSKGVFYAIKVIEKRKLIHEKCRVQTEIEIMASLQHPFLSHLFCAYQVGVAFPSPFFFPSHSSWDNGQHPQDQARVYLVSGYAVGGELFNRLRRRGRFQEEEAMFYAGEIALAISYLHKVKDKTPCELLIQWI